MELVYLWVEDYKNIKKQGFNFSPRFECTFHDKYDEKGKLKDGCNLDIQPKEYIENFFEDNINVTAIVGKNGSGKSRILELISLFRFERLRVELSSKTILMIFRNGNNLYISSGYSTSFGGDSFKSFNIDNVINDTSLTIVSKENIHHDNLFWLILFTNGLSDFTEGKNLLESDYYNGSSTGSQDKEYDFYYKFSDLLKDNTDIFNILNEDFIFDSMNMEFDLQNLAPNSYYKRDEMLPHIEEILQRRVDNSKGNLNKITIEIMIYTFLMSYFLSEYVDVILAHPDYSNRDKLKEELLDNRLIPYIYENINSNTDNEEFIKSIKVILNQIKDDYKIYQLSVPKVDNSTKIKYINNYEEIIEYILNNFTLDSTSLRLKSKTEEINPINISKFYEFLSNNGFYNDLELNGKFYLSYTNSKKNHITFNSLSTGEKQLLKFITNFAYTLTQTGNRVILLDEIETALHPQWQKNFINIIIKFIYEIRKRGLVSPLNKYHLIFTTHSPFLLSDIPKENIIFLKDGKNDKGINHKQTFGANIHTLLSDSFFMEDGLMGEFAKSKIDKAITLLNQDKLDEKDLKYCEQIISIIGEPIVKNQLQRRLDSKRLSKIDAISQKIKDMSYELKILKEHQSKIVQDELRDKGKKQYKQRFEDD